MAYHASQTRQPTIDRLSASEALGTMLDAQANAIATALGARTQIAQAAEVVATALSEGASLFYAAAGSSGLMALADACELPGTFGIPTSQIRIYMAGGVPVDGHMPGDTEDDHSDGIHAAATMQSGDVAIVVSASGTTPYACAFAQTARDAGHTVVGIANIDGSALLEVADIAIALPTAPEVISGSTRLGAGTAQKAVLNAISTQAGILMGHVHDGLMVNLKADNLKLRRRASDIVCQIAGVTEATAETALAACNYDTKQAIVMAHGVDAGRARDMLDAAKGRLSAILPNLASPGRAVAHS